MREFDCRPLLRPAAAALRFLPEGPCHYGEGEISWVAIQHGADALAGSVNVCQVASATNTTYELPGRPGFAHPVGGGRFVAGVERHLGHFDTNDGSWTPFSPEIDAGVEGTIINDGESFAKGIVFGTKDLQFAEKKAGLYLWRTADQQLIQLRSDQICSNGKFLMPNGSNWTLYDIDSPTQTVVRYELNVEAGELSKPEVVLDFTDGTIFPDGMIQSPDGESAIIAFYDPNDSEYGVARQYRLSNGQLEATWKTANSPRVTCPQIINTGGTTHLVLTTADEGMTAEQQAQHVNAGVLFTAPYGL